VIMSARLAGRVFRSQGDSSRGVTLRLIGLSLASVIIAIHARKFIYSTFSYSCIYFSLVHSLSSPSVVAIYISPLPNGQDIFVRTLRFHGYLYYTAQV